jgi:uncharacterized protein
VMSKKRSCERIASATAATSLVVWGELIDQLRHTDPALDGRIVFEHELRRPLEPKLTGDAALENAVRRLQPRQALLLLSLGPEHADVDARVTEIRRGLDSRHRHEADPGILQLAHRLGEDLADGLVHAPHSAAHAWYSTRVALHALALAAVAAWCFLTALAGGLVGLVLGNIRLPALLLVSSSPAAGAGANIGVSGVAAATAAVTQVRAGRIHWRVFWWMAPPSVAGAILGGLVSGELPGKALLVVIGVLLIAFGIDLLRPRGPIRRGDELNIPAAVASGAVIGFLGGVVGLILGSLRMPALLRFVGEEPVRAVGTNLLVGVFVGAAGVVGHVPSGIDWTAFAIGVAASAPGALLGARLTGRLDERQLLRAVGIVLLFAGTITLVQAAA